MSELAVELKNIGNMDPLRFTVQGLVDRISTAIHKHLANREMKNIGKYDIVVSVLINSESYETSMAVKFTDDEGAETLVLKGKDVADLLSEDNRAMMYLLLNS